MSKNIATFHLFLTKLDEFHFQKNETRRNVFITIRRDIRNYFYWYMYTVISDSISKNIDLINMSFTTLSRSLFLFFANEKPCCLRKYIFFNLLFMINLFLNILCQMTFKQCFSLFCVLLKYRL